MFRRRPRGDRVDPVAAAALAQRVRAADEAVVGIDTTLHAVQLQPGALWRDHSGAQVTAHAWWLAKVFTRAASAHHHAVDEHTPETLAQATAIVEAAEHWTVVAGDREEALRAGRPAHRLHGGVEPVPLPGWAVTPETHAALWPALVAVVAEIRADADRFLGFGFPRRFTAVVDELAATTTRGVERFAHDVELRWSTGPEERAATTAEALRLLRDGELFLAGQAWWAPRLLGREYERARRRPAGIDDLDVPDPWALTDPRERAARAGDPASVEALVTMWEKLSRPGAALELQREIDDARAARRLRRREGRAAPTPPWPSRHLVRYPVTIGGRTFAGGDVVVLFVDPDGEPQVRVSRSGRVVRPVELLGGETGSPR